MYVFVKKYSYMLMLMTGMLFAACGNQQPPTIDEEVGGCCVVCIVIEKSFCAEPSCYRFILCRSASVS